MKLAAINDLGRHTKPQRDELCAAIARVVDSGWFVMGRELDAFEAEFAGYSGSRHCIGVANGTEALEIALRGVGVGQGSQVLTVANAGAYSTAAIYAVGARPVYVDVRDDTLLVDEAELFQRLSESPAPAAVIVTHLYGRLVSGVAEIAEAARRSGTAVIEDCAQAHGARSRRGMAGTFGDVGCFSFYPTKNLGALGDGGALITDDLDLAAKVRRLRQYGWSSKYRSDTAGGRNSRLDEIQAAVLRVKLPQLDAWNRRRREISTKLSQRIVHPRVRSPIAGHEDYVAHLHVVRTDDRSALQEHLRSRGIASDVHYPLVDYAQAAYVDADLRNCTPRAEQASREVLTLPCFPEMSQDDIDAVVDAVNSW